MHNIRRYASPQQHSPFAESPLNLEISEQWLVKSPEVRPSASEPMPVLNAHRITTHFAPAGGGSSGGGGGVAAVPGECCGESYYVTPKRPTVFPHDMAGRMHVSLQQGGAASLTSPPHRLRSLDSPLPLQQDGEHDDHTQHKPSHEESNSAPVSLAVTPRAMASHRHFPESWTRQVSPSPWPSATRARHAPLIQETHTSPSSTPHTHSLLTPHLLVPLALGETRAKDEVMRGEVGDDGAARVYKHTHGSKPTAARRHVGSPAATNVYESGALFSPTAPMSGRSRHSRRGDLLDLQSASLSEAKGMGNAAEHVLSPPAASQSAHTRMNGSALLLSHTRSPARPARTETLSKSATTAHASIHSGNGSHGSDEMGVQRALLNAVHTLQSHLSDLIVSQPSAPSPLPDEVDDTPFAVTATPTTARLQSPVNSLDSSDVMAFTEEERRAVVSMCALMERRLTNGSLGSSQAGNSSSSSGSVASVRNGRGSDLTQHADGGLVSARVSTTGDQTSLIMHMRSLQAPPQLADFSQLPPHGLPTAGARAERTPMETAESRSASFGEGFSKSVASGMADYNKAVRRIHCAAGRALIMLESWRWISVHCYEAFATALFRDMLVAQPEYTALFNDTTVAHQSLAVMDMLGRAVVAYVNSREMMDLMRELGARHRVYGITDTHYRAMESSFFVALRDFLPKSEWATVEPVWKSFWNTTIELMSMGARSERGEFFSTLHKAAWVAEVQKLMQAVAPLESNGAESLRQHTFPLAMYEIAVAAQPEMAVFSNMATVRTGDRLMNSLNYIVAHLTDDNQSALEEYIKLVSARHEEYGVSAQALQSFSEYFVLTVKNFLSQQLPEGVYKVTWTPLSRQYLLAFWGFVVQRWSDGFEKKQERTALLHGLELDGSQPITFVFTDIENSTRLWESNAATMSLAVRQHHSIIRSLIADVSAFEVKTVGDAFMIACTNPLMALKIAVGIQLELMRNPITAGFVTCAGGVGTGDAACWRDDTLRVRVGVHMGTAATPVYDAVHNRYDYYGPAVNCAARVEAAAAGGQILMTRECVEALGSTAEFSGKPVQWQLRTFENIDSALQRGSFSRLQRRATFAKERAFSDFVHFYDSPDLTLRGISQPVKVLSVVPRSLDGRRFPGQGQLVAWEELTRGNSNSQQNPL